ncbi:uncharacterized protein LOC133196523 [Saccostrea echinata]|uniref:uncharacterized protein LOC133196523 n=1 Tax=Saccostrea echinata TaxID=191078 RepID=UPI002A83039E|nr:uncharacterized protein LOC133196523 [Saccostrea echinata]
MKAHLPLLAAVAFGHTSEIKGQTSDDEDSLNDGSGSGCFQIPTDRICNCNTLLTCLQTCDDLTCNQVLTPCLGDDSFNGNCGSQSNSLDRPQNASNTDMTLWITGGILSIILLSAAVIMIALRKRKCCCTRKNQQAMGSGPQVVSYQPHLQDPEQDHHYARIPINSVGIYVQEKENSGFYSKVNEEISPSVTSFSSPKYELSQNIATENDYQTMPEIRETHEQKSDGRSIGLTSPKDSLELKKENKTIHYTNQSYQLIKDTVPSGNYQEMNGGKAPENPDHCSHYQPMDATDRYWAMSNPNGTTAEEEYTVMGESNNGNCGKDATQSNLYGNEIGMQEVNAYVNESVGRARDTTEITNDDEVYEKMSY